MPAKQPIADVIAQLTDNEKSRLLSGRYDWRENDWQDHCGEVGCPMCEGAFIPDGNPAALSPADKELRNWLLVAHA